MSRLKFLEAYFSKMLSDRRFDGHQMTICVSSVMGIMSMRSSKALQYNYFSEKYVRFKSKGKILQSKSRFSIKLERLINSPNESYDTHK